MMEVRNSQTQSWLQGQLYARRGQAAVSKITKEIKDLAAITYHCFDMSESAHPGKCVSVTFCICKQDM